MCRYYLRFAAVFFATFLTVFLTAFFATFLAGAFFATFLAAFFATGMMKILRLKISNGYSTAWFFYKEHVCVKNICLHTLSVIKKIHTMFF